MADGAAPGNDSHHNWRGGDGDHPGAALTPFRPFSILVGRRYRLGVRTDGSQPSDRGSNPRSATSLLTARPPDTSSGDSRAGLLYALAAYGLWGFAPIYFKALRTVSLGEVLAHRVVWSVVCLVAFAVATGQLRAIIRMARDRRRLAWLAASSILIGFNWTLFIWAVSSGRILEASLGYYINPIFNVLLGAVVLGERLHRLEWASVALAGLAVAWLTFTLGVVPVVPLALASSFALYGLVRKRLGVGSLEGLALETALLLPAALGWILHRWHEGTLAFGHRGAALDLLLVAAGPMTAVPLLCFTSAVSRLRLATVGFMQYLSPTLQLLLAVFLYREPFGRERLVAFVAIWVALALFAAHNSRRAPAVTPPD